MDNTGDQGEVNQREGRSESKKCVVCASDLAADARKCIRCNEYQGRLMRLLAVGNSTLALLTALVSVLVVALPTFYSALVPKRDELVIRFMGVDTTRKCASILVSNLGNRPGAIGGAWIIPSADAMRVFPQAKWSLSVPDTTVVRPGESFQFPLRSQESIPIAAEQFEKSYEFRLVVQVIRFDGTLDERPLTFRAGLPR